MPVAEVLAIWQPWKLCVKAHPPYCLSRTSPTVVNC